MIAYTTVGANDMEKSVAFYDAVFATAGIGRLWDNNGFVGYGVDMAKPMFGVTKPENGEAATFGNGTMIAIALQEPAQVDAMHAKALELGAVNEGDAGPRGDTGFYCGYFRDPDGNKLNAFCMVPPQG
jgi:catechol 2,3-dioxygenase-like lactoylglutathione lyase family enzyme